MNTYNGKSSSSSPSSQFLFLMTGWMMIISCHLSSYKNTYTSTYAFITSSSTHRLFGQRRTLGSKSTSTSSSSTSTSTNNNNNIVAFSSLTPFFPTTTTSTTVTVQTNDSDHRKKNNNQLFHVFPIYIIHPLKHVTLKMPLIFIHYQGLKLNTNFVVLLLVMLLIMVLLLLVVALLVQVQVPELLG